MQKLDSRIKDIELINNTVFIDIGIENDLLPINLIGDGIIKVMSILIELISLENRLLLIDEIENELHFSVTKTFIKLIIEISLENNIQLFTTTHSYESLNLITKLAKKKSMSKKYLKIFKLENNDNYDEIKPIRIEENDFFIMLEKN